MRTTVALTLTACLFSGIANANPKRSVAKDVGPKETGHHTLHQTAMIGGKLCMTAHEHHGESPPVASAKAGRTLAIHKWQIFTREEYGAAWGSYAASVGKTEKCVGTAPNLICSVESRPCRSLK